MLDYENIRAKMTMEMDFKEGLLSLNKIQQLKQMNEKEMDNNIWQIAYFKVPDRNKILEAHYKEALEDIRRIYATTDCKIY